MPVAEMLTKEMLEIEQGQLVEGEMRGFSLEGTPVLVAKVGGKFYAIRNKCTHLGCKLSDGMLDGTIITCPCHGSKFDVTNGKLIAPVTNWPKLMQKAVSLYMRDEPVFDVQTHDGKIRVSAKK